MARSRRTRPAADPQGLLDALPLDGGPAAKPRQSGRAAPALTEQLYTAHPSLPEGDLARRRAGTVSSRALAVIATRLDLGAYVKLGRGEDLTGGRSKASILADTTEAVIGAVHLACGQDVS